MSAHIMATIPGGNQFSQTANQMQGNAYIGARITPQAMQQGLSKSITLFNLEIISRNYFSVDDLLQGLFVPSFQSHHSQLWCSYWVGTGKAVDHAIFGIVWVRVVLRKAGVFDFD